jgi:hypothetical protein
MTPAADRQRVLELRRDALKHPCRFDLDVVFAEMCWPDDAAMRKRLVNSAFRQHMINRPDMTIDQPRLLATMGNALPVDHIHEASKPRILHGLLAGRVLQLAVDAFSDGETPSKRDCVEAAIAVARRSRDGGVACLSHSTFEHEIWPVFRPVAHIWSAALKAASEDPTATFPCNVARLMPFLEDAEAYRRLGETYQWASRKPILRIGETLLLPNVIDPAELIFRINHKC